MLIAALDLPISLTNAVLLTQFREVPLAQGCDAVSEFVEDLQHAMAPVGAGPIVEDPANGLGVSQSLLLHAQQQVNGPPIRVRPRGGIHY